jgi:3'(2'), 5'-bisphosphate nucleotidase
VVSADLAALVRIASDAARVVMEVYGREFSVEYKAPQDPVTEADRRANALIVEQLTREFPGVPIVAEESDPETFADYRKSDQIFFVDPVDGTREFIDRNGEFAVMIGLVEGGRAVAAVIDAPARGEVFAGWVGEGAYVVRGGEARPITVSATGDIKQGLIVGSRSHRGPKLEQALARLQPREVLVMGSAGLKGTLVASAAVEAYVAPGDAGKRWDACAADALVCAAGGTFTDTFGDAIDYRAPSLTNDRGLLATNGHVHAALLEAFAALRDN